MGRGKLKMELIADEKTRKITFQKRKKGMIKKCYEFSTLCGIDVCMIIYGPKQIGRPRELVTWPTESSEVARIIKQFQTNTLYKPPKRIFNLSDIFIDRKRKIDAEISKLRKVYCAVKFPISDELISSFTRDQLGFLLTRLDAKIEHAKTMIDFRRENQNHANHHVQNVFHDQKPAVNPLNLHRHHHHHRVLMDDHMQLPLQMVPHFDSNSPISMMMLMNGQAGIENGASSCDIIDHHHHQYMINRNHHLCGPVFNDPAVGMIENNTMFSNIISGSSMEAQYSQLVQVQQPMPYIQYNQTVNAAGIPSQWNGSDEGNRFDDEFNEFLYKNKDSFMDI